MSSSTTGSYRQRARTDALAATAATAGPPAHTDAQAARLCCGDRGEVHPRDVDADFSRGTVTNYWSGSSAVTTHLLEDLHYRGCLRVARRQRGIRIYALRDSPAANSGLAPRDRIDALVDVVVNTYAPLPACRAYAIGRLRYAGPQWRAQLKAR